MSVYFTRYAQEKFETLARHEVAITRDQVIDAVTTPDIIDDSHPPLLIAQKSFDDDHVLRVVYKHTSNTKMIITFYPGKKSLYEKNE